MNILEVATKKIVTAGKSESIRAVVRKMAEHKVSCVVVMSDAGFPLGVFTESDLLEVMCAGVDLLRPVVEFAASKLLLVNEEMSVYETQLRAHAQGARCVLVRQHGGHVVGLLTETDFQGQLGQNIFDRLPQVREVMDTLPPLLPINTALSEVAKFMRAGKLDYALFGEDRVAKGIITQGDWVQALAKGEAWANMPACELMSTPVLSIHHQAPVTGALEQMQSMLTRHIAVVDDQGRCLGVISHHSVMERAAEELLAIKTRKTTSEPRLEELSFQHMMNHLPVPATYFTLDGVGVYLNRKFTELLGYDLGDIPSMAQWWTLACPDPDHRQLVRARWEAGLQQAQLAQQPVGPTVVKIRTKAGKALKLRINATILDNGVVTAFEDLTVSHQQNQLLEFGQKILELVVRGEPLHNVAQAICEQVEAHFPRIVCSVLQIDQQGLLRTIASKNLPEAWLSMIDGMAIGDNVGACGAAAFHNTEVLSSDIATDPAWAPLVKEALSFNLASCWSMPIRSDAGVCLGTIAAYWDHPVHNIEPFWRDLFSTGAKLASLSFERHRRQTLLDEMYFRLALGEEAADMGSWSWSESCGVVNLSEHAKQILGADTDTQFKLHESMWAWVHEADKPKVSEAIHEYRRGHLPAALVLRRHPDLGPTKYLKLTAKPFSNAIGGTSGLAGSILDVTESIQKTNSLHDQLNELRRWQHVMLDREGRVQDLKREVNQLLVNMGQSPKYIAY